MANGHGGFRSGAGRPKKALADALIDGTRPSRIKAAKMDGVQLVDDETPTIPECMEYLKDAQRAGVELQAEKFFEDIWRRLCKYKCENLFEVNYLQRFAMQQARYAQLEQLISKLGFLSKTESGGAKDNPLEAMALNRLKVLNTMQASIESIIRENCSEPFSGLAVEDTMEAILSGRV